MGLSHPAGLLADLNFISLFYSRTAKALLHSPDSFITLLGEGSEPWRSRLLVATASTYQLQYTNVVVV